MDQVQQVPRNKLSAWVAFMYAYARVTRDLGGELDQTEHLSLATYDVLVQLSEAGGSLRLRELLSRIIISQPGLSRRVDRLITAGLAQRRPDPSDGRGVIIRLTRSGRAALRVAAHVHMAGINREFAAIITDEEAAVLTAVFSRMLTSPTSAAATE